MKIRAVFSLPLLLASAATPLLAVDSFEEDDACIPSPTVIRDGEVQAHDFEDDSEDWVTLNACAGRGYTLETLNLGTATDTVLELYDGDCTTLLADDDDGGTGSASMLNWNAAANGTYHLRIRQADSTTGLDRAYDLSLVGDTSTCATWAVTYGTDEAPNIRDMVVTPDGGFSVVGEVGSTAWALEADAEGQVEWERTYGTGYFSNVRLSATGTYLLTGLSPANKVWVAELDSSGNLVRSHEFGAGLSSDIRGSWFSDTEVVTLAHNRENMPPDAFWVVRADHDGNISSQIEYSFLQHSIGAVYIVEALPDGGILVGGWNGPDTFLLRLDEMGGIVWAKDAPTLVAGVRPTSDGGFIGIDLFSAGLFKLDSAGDVVWSREYGSDPSLYGVAVAANGDYLISGQLSATDPLLRRYWLARTDPAGNILWQQSLGGFIPRETPDGGVAVTGATDIAAYLSHIAADGSGCDTTTEIVSPTSGSFFVLDLTDPMDSTATLEASSVYNPSTGNASPTYTAQCGFPCQDTDADGFGLPGNAVCGGGSAADCDDADDAVYPGALEVCGDGLNNDCDEPAWPDPLAVGENDDDFDGSPSCADCDDADPDTYPDAPETNDGLDNQCAGDAGFGLIDEISGDPSFPDPNTFCWTAQPGATSYEVARSTDPDLGGTCDLFEETTSCHSDTDVPPAGEVYYYLVRALAPNVGSWGADGDGAERFPQCISETICNDGLDNDYDGRIDCSDPDCYLSCEPLTYSFADGPGDDVAPDSLFDFFESVNPAAGDFLYFEMSGSGVTRRFCATHADWYRNSYVTNAPGGAETISGGWDFWHTTDGIIWTYAPAVRSNLFGSMCQEAYSWCAEPEPSILLRNSVRPGLADSCEAAEFLTGGVPNTATCGAVQSITIRVGTARASTCGF